ncbi:DNA replication licensing factor Mcm3-like [Metopolophium dirhodum]|uniref:DNA replication licensing factor Mcm3-like n=1 Tax=Metopolophium dirhodum TaxID=44670 RepID=UPI00298F67AC|nr:DNA replication licensing factor Mcm3-like [Metopolophium dirhodum]
MDDSVVLCYMDFLCDELTTNVYHKKIKMMIRENERRIYIDIGDVRKYNIVRANELLNNFLVEEVALKRAIKECVQCIDPSYANKHEEFFVGFYGAFGSNHVTPRTLRCKFLGRLVCLDGVVTMRSDIKSVLVKSVHYCPATRKMHEHTHTDFLSTSYSFDSATSNCNYPSRDNEGNLLETEFGISVFKDRQSLIIQESTENSPAGQAARSVDVVVEHDLVDMCKPGDRVMIIGHYRSFLPPKGSIFFKTMLIANNIVLKNT